MMILFSDALRDLVRPRLAPALQQHELFHDVVDTTGRVWTDFAAGAARLGEFELAAEMLGTFAEDQTFQWAWDKDQLTGTPGVALSLRLKELGERHEVPELAEGMIDLGHHPDPRLATNVLGLAAVALLDARGLFTFAHGGRALTLMITTDPGLPVARPDPANAADLLSSATRVFPDRHPHDVVVTGYAAHHDLHVRPVPDGLEVGFPQGDLLVAAVGEDGGLGSVTVIGPDGGAPTALERPTPLSTAVASAPPTIMRLLPRLIPGLANVLHQNVALHAHLDELGWDKAPPVWDADEELLRYGDRFDATAREIARVSEDGTWEWAGAEWEGAARLRELARECGADVFAADRTNLAVEESWGNVAVVLARSAVGLGEEARGLMLVPDDDGGGRYFAVTDPRVPHPLSDLDELCGIILSTADLVQPIVPAADRYAMMRSMVIGYFERHNVSPMTVGEPEMLMGRHGLHEVRVMFSQDGTVNTAFWGMLGTLG